MINLANTKLGTSGLTPSGLNLNNNLVNNLITTYAETNVANLRSFDIQNKNTGQIYGINDDEDDIDNIDTRNGNISSCYQTFKAKNYSYPGESKPAKIYRAANTEPSLDAYEKRHGDTFQRRKYDNITMNIVMTRK